MIVYESDKSQRLRDEGHTVGSAGDQDDEQDPSPLKTDPLTRPMYDYSDALKLLIKECLLIQSAGRPTSAWLVWRTRYGLQHARIAEKNLNPLAPLPSITMSRYPDPGIANRWHSGQAFGPIPLPPPLPPGQYYSRIPPHIIPPIPAPAPQPGQTPVRVNQWAQFAANQPGAAPVRVPLPPPAPIINPNQVAHAVQAQPTGVPGQAPIPAGNQAARPNQNAQVAVLPNLQALNLGAQGQQPQPQAQAAAFQPPIVALNQAQQALNQTQRGLNPRARPALAPRSQAINIPVFYFNKARIPALTCTISKPGGQTYTIGLVDPDPRMSFGQLNDRLIHNGCQIPRHRMVLTSPSCLCANN